MKLINEYVNELICERQDFILSYYLGDDAIIEGIDIKGAAISIVKFLAKSILIPIIVILALFGLCYKMAIVSDKHNEETAQDRKNKMIQLLRKNPALAQNINKLIGPIFDSLCKIYPKGKRYFSKKNITSKDIRIIENKKDSKDIVIEVDIIKFNSSVILKDATGYTDYDEYCESIGHDPQGDEPECKELNIIADEIDSCIASINSFLKGTYKGIIRLNYGCSGKIEPFLNLGLTGNDSYISIIIKGNIDRFDLPNEFKNKVKETMNKMM